MSAAGALRRSAGSQTAPSDRDFLLPLCAGYAALIALLTLTISPYFALGWDVKTFIGAGWSLLDWQDPFALYLRSRADFYWPYAYPPLHAALVALVLPAHSLVPAIPESLLARAPVVFFDVAMAWFLHARVGRATGLRPAARLAAAAWLFNPVTLYQTAIQAHFESEWVFLILAAYALAPDRRPGQPAPPRRLAAATVCLAGAILIKQVAVILAVPFWLYLWLSGRRWPAMVSGLATAGMVLTVCLPFALRSPDFLYMNTAYVAEMPVQTQSAVVWLLAYKEHLTSSVTSDIFLVRYATPILALAAGLVSLASLRRGRDLNVTGLLVVLVFFLLSPKVMAYYYAILLPFAIMVLFSRGELRRASIVFAALAWILLSPYYASWARPEHLPLYAALGTVNSVFFLWLFAGVWRLPPEEREQHADVEAPASARWDGGDAARLAGLVVGLGVAMIVPALAQPAHTIAWAGGRVDVAELAAAGALLAAGLAVVAAVATMWERRLGACSRRWAFAAMVLFYPLAFMQFYVTKESTRILETLLTGNG